MLDYSKSPSLGDRLAHCSVCANERQRPHPASSTELALRGAASAGLLGASEIIGFVRWGNADCALTFGTKAGEIAVFGMDANGRPERVAVSHWKAIFACR
jgi:hypothetical protein